MPNRNLWLALCVLFLVTACSSGPTIRTNVNRSVNFHQYKSFGFFEELDTDKRYQSLVSQYLKEVTIQEMTTRGFVLVADNPDLLINFHTNVENKQVIRQTPSTSYGGGYGGYYGYRRSFYYDPLPSYDTYVDNYQEGTLNIDIVDRVQNKMIWEGVAEGRLSQETLTNLQPALHRVVGEIFAEFPIPAPVTAK